MTVVVLPLSWSRSRWAKGSCATRSVWDAGCAVTIDHIAIRIEKPRPTLPADDGRLSRPLFTLREAAGYLGMPVSTLHAWGARLIR
jgi:hypothetical protein